MQRTTAQTIESHLAYRRSGNLEADLRENVSIDVIILSNYGTFKGHQGVRESSRLLSEALPNATFDYQMVLTDDRFSFLEWSGESEESFVEDGADSFVVEDGKIVFQSIHYTVQKKTD